MSAPHLRSAIKSQKVVKKPSLQNQNEAKYRGWFELS